MSTVDLFSSDNCPVGHRCEACGDAADVLVATTAETPLGVLCLTLCQRCGDASKVRLGRLLYEALGGGDDDR